jgi:hypothetical protein
MTTREHVHSTNALCPECCRIIASPHYRFMSVVSDILYPLRGFIDDATDEIGNILTRMLGEGRAPTADQEQQHETQQGQAPPGLGARSYPPYQAEAPEPTSIVNPVKPTEPVKGSHEDGPITMALSPEPELAEQGKSADPASAAQSSEVVPANGAATGAGKDWIDYAKSNYMKIRKTSEQALSKASQEGEEEEVWMRGKVVAKSMSPITATALMGLQFESRVEEVTRKKEGPESLPAPTSAQPQPAVKDEQGQDVSDSKRGKERDWMALILPAPQPVQQKEEQEPAEEQPQVHEARSEGSLHVPDREYDQPQAPDAGERSTQYLQQSKGSDSSHHADHEHHGHHHDGRTVCEKCINKLARPGHPYWEEVKENLLVFGRGAKAVAQVIGIGAFGAAMVAASLFPNAIRPKTLEQMKQEEDERIERKRREQEEEEAEQERWQADQAKYQAQKDNAHKAWKDAGEALWKAKRILQIQGEKAADEEFWKAWRNRGDETAAEKKAWEEARQAWEAERANQYARQKADDDAFWKAYHQTWDERQAEQIKWEEERAARWLREKQEADRAAEEAERARYNKMIQDANDMVKYPRLYERNDLFADDQLGSEVNSRAKAVEDGKEDPRNLMKAAEELHESRRQIWEADRKRDDCYRKAQDLMVKARRELDMADSAIHRGDYESADNYSRNADYLFRDADAAMNEYRSI